MNPTTLSSDQPPPPPPPLQQQQQQQQPQPLRTCPRHPQEQFTGFCPECLCERLAELNPNNTNSNTSLLPRKPPTSSTAAAALRAIFRTSSTASGKNNTSSSSSRPPTSSFLPELRRTKSFSASKNEALSGAFEPQRRSCDVRARNSTLWNLFTHEAEKKVQQNKETSEAEAINQVPVVETKEEEEEEKEVELVVEEEEEEEESLDRNDVVEEEDDEIRALEEPNVNVNVIEERVAEIVVEEEEQEQELKTMKDHIDLDSSNSQPKKDSKIAGSLWSAASVFSKKLQKWRQKQKMKKRRNGVVDGGSGDGGPAALPVEKPIGRQFRDTQSEIADYGFGRRSCDTDPRFSLDIGRMSLDAGRMSFDDPRYSFEEPRASWDGYLLGRTAIPRTMPTMLSVVEDSPAPVHPLRTDTQIPVEEPLNSVNGDDSVPGGTAQTREYYSDSSSRRRKSFERSNSMRRSSFSSVVGEMEELKCGSFANNSNPNVNVNGNAKVTPAGVDYVHGPKLAFLDRDLSSNSARDDCCSESFDIGFGDTASVVGNGDRKEPKKSRRWGKGWSIWGLIHRKGGNGGGNKDDDDDRYSRANGVGRSYSESWQDLRGVPNGDPRSAFNGRIFRSNSSVSWRNAQSIGGGSFGSVRRNGVVQGNGTNGKKGKDEFVLERNRSARYSPNHGDNNGLLRFYLTPMRGSRRNGSVKSRSSQAHSIARSVLRLY